MQSLQQYLKDVCFDNGEVDFRNDYSGRGMYGRKCVGIVSTKTMCMEMIARVIISVKDDLKHSMNMADYEKDTLFEEYVSTLLDFVEDSMGMSGVILYWPELVPIEEPDDPEDDDESWNNSDGHGE